MNYIIAASTDVGAVKENNQDSYNLRTVTTPRGKAVLAILCDGMGGLQKGELASASLVQAFCRWAQERLPAFCSVDFDDNVLKEEWTDIVHTYNEKIKAYGKREGINVGTTVTALLLTDSRYGIINVGDTRAYEITDTLHQLTQDQSFVAREVALGNMTEEEAKTDPRRSVLLQCVGASDNVFPDLFFGDTKQNAVYMLCSDGFHHELAPEEIVGMFRPEMMLNAVEMKTNIDDLIEMSKQRGERDNITVLTIRTF